MFLHGKAEEEWTDNWNATDKVNYIKTRVVLSYSLQNFPFYFWFDYFKRLNCLPHDGGKQLWHVNPSPPPAPPPIMAVKM